MRRKFTNPFGFVHSSDMIGWYTHTRKQANLFFPLFSFFFLFYTNRTGLPHTRAAGSVLFAAGNCKPEHLSANSYRAA